MRLPNGVPRTAVVSGPRGLKPGFWKVECGPEGPLFHDGWRSVVGLRLGCRLPRLTSKRTDVNLGHLGLAGGLRSYRGPSAIPRRNDGNRTRRLTTSRRSAIPRTHGTMRPQDRTFQTFGRSMPGTEKHRVQRTRSGGGAFSLGRA